MFSVHKTTIIFRWIKKIPAQTFIMSKGVRNSTLCGVTDINGTACERVQFYAHVIILLQINWRAWCDPISFDEFASPGCNLDGRIPRCFVFVEIAHVHWIREWAYSSRTYMKRALMWETILIGQKPSATPETQFEPNRAFLALCPNPVCHWRTRNGPIV